MANETIRQVTHIDNVKLSDDGRALVLIDQTRLPNELVYLTLTEAQEIWDAIHYLRVRGAPAIGIAAGYGLYVLARQIGDTITSSVLAPEDFVSADEHSAYAAGGTSDLRGDVAVFIAKLNKQAEFLNSSRPTAVNLSWALKRMLSCALKASGTGAGIPEILEALHSECVAIHEEDIRMCRAISEYGLSLLKEGDGVLTHCNAGPLATSRYGTGQGPLFLAKEQGVNIRVFADETRPLLQGARLTSYELARAGVDVTLICDNMASIVMKNGWVQACMVGCDRVAANGDAANKIGTSGVAILAKHYGIPFYVLGPSSTIDMNCPTGDDIKIEERKPDEIKEMFYEKPVALPEVKCYNPAFDVTDHSLITAIITEKGIIRPPFKEQFATLFS